MSKRIGVTLLFILVVLLFVGTFAIDGVRTFFMKKFLSHRPAPVVTVASSTATLQPWRDSIPAVGTLTAAKGIDVTPRATGQVSAIFFRSGQSVKKGDILVQLDDRTAQQNLNSDKATLANAELIYSQNEKLVKTGSVSRTVLNQSLTSLRTAQAKLESDKLALRYLKVIAPFSGKLGIRQINVGQFVQVNTKIVTLQKLSPIYADFSLPTQYLSNLSVGLTVRVSSNSFPGKEFTGKVEAISPQINSGTRTVSVRARLENKQQLLLPGSFVSVDVLLPKKQQVVTVPVTAISYSLFGDNLYVISSVQKNKKEVKVAQQRIVTLGKRFGNHVIVLKGLKPGEEVVSAGQLKLHNGSLVTINNKVKM